MMVLVISKINVYQHVKKNIIKYLKNIYQKKYILTRKKKSWKGSFRKSGKNIFFRKKYSQKEAKKAEKAKKVGRAEQAKKNKKSWKVKKVVVEGDVNYFDKFVLNIG